MTTVKPPKLLRRTLIYIPYPPDPHPDDMTNFNPLSLSGNVHFLAAHLGNPDTTLITGDRYIVPRPGMPASARRYPDLLIAFNVNPTLYEDQNAYIISEQGKPPDFVLEIASRSTWQNDIGDKVAYYAAMGIPEYWRFDETGEFHRTLLAGDRLVDGVYRPIEIRRRADGSLEGHSASLDLHLRWESRTLGWYDPATGRHIITLADALAEAAEARAARQQAEIQLDTVTAQRDAAIREAARLNALVRKLRNDNGG